MEAQTNSTQAGITLVELLVAVAVVAIVGAFATNMASAAIHAARTSNAVSSLYASLTRARSFAAAAGVDVVLCPSLDGNTCTPGYHWESGWIAFAATHAGDRTGDEPIIVRQQALPLKVHLITSPGRTRLRFQPSGSNAGSNATFTFCDGRGAKAAVAYAMANNGSLRPSPVDAAYVGQACGGF